MIASPSEGGEENNGTFTERDLLRILTAYEICNPKEREAIKAYLDKNIAYRDRGKALRVAGYKDSYIRRERAAFWRREHIRHVIEVPVGAVPASTLTAEALQRDLEDLWRTGSTEQKTRLAPFMAKFTGADADDKLTTPIVFLPDALAKVGQDTTEDEAPALPVEGESVGCVTHDKSDVIS